MSHKLFLISVIYDNYVSYTSHMLHDLESRKWPRCCTIKRKDINVLKIFYSSIWRIPLFVHAVLGTLFNNLSCL